jgi:multicomponent Na+:H+ antiporter subunit E
MVLRSEHCLHNAMRHFLLNIGLSSAWAALMGTFDATTLAAGFAVGYVVLWATQPALGPSAYVKGVGRAVAFLSFYLTELVWSSIQVAVDVCRPRLRMCPGVVAIPLRARTDAEITVLANLISLTPGTLSLDVSPDKRLLYVHAMDLENGPEALRADIRDTLEARVLMLLRGEAPSSAETDGPAET